MEYETRVDGEWNILPGQHARSPGASSVALGTNDVNSIVEAEPFINCPSPVSSTRVRLQADLGGSTDVRNHLIYAAIARCEAI